jgi:prepilin-type N-terminal cleavage/methylation domain-containing protein
MIKNKGFTLIELLVVIAIIGLLSSVVLASLNSARIKSRDVVRKENLIQIRNALELYALSNNGNYPTTSGIMYSSETGDVAPYGPSAQVGIWSPTFSTYMPIIPKDPLGGLSTIPACAGGWKRSLSYMSDGTDYKVLTHCAPEAPVSNTDSLLDPRRNNAGAICGNPPDGTGWAWAVYSPGGKCF